jgi:hypothetical protein
VRYSRDVVSAGGLAAFVEAAAGRRLALVQAAVWTVSYFLYLPYTVPDIVYEMLAVVFPGLAPWRPLLELTIPLGVIALVLAGTLPALRLLLASAVAQLAVLLVLGAVVIGPAGAPARSFTHLPGTHAAWHGTAAIALLFVCGSLPIFLGAEVAGGGRVIRRTLVLSGVAVAAYVLFAVFAFAAVDPALLRGTMPGYDIAGAYSGRALAVAVGLGAAVSVAGVIVAEYLALSRLLFSVTGIPVRRVLAWIAAPFFAADALSLLNPEWFDENVLRPSLIALFLSQLAVFAVFPLYRRRRGTLTPVDVAITAVAFAVMAFGLWRGIFAPVST